MQDCVSKLESYLSTIEKSPAQRSQEWYDIRKNTIGGSEIAAILGYSPFGSLQKMIAGKIGLNPFNGNFYCHWGSLFEHETEQFAQIVLKMDEKIKECGSVPGVFDCQRYSPDGLGIVKLLDIDDNINYYIVLFEFKSPSGSIPDGKIAKHYISQVQTGMLSIPITEYTIFVNNSYRRCALGDFAFTNTYDKVLHKLDAKKPKKYKLNSKKPLAIGIIFFYQYASEFEKVKAYYDYDSDFEHDAQVSDTINLCDSDQSDNDDIGNPSDPEYNNVSPTEKSYFENCDLDLLFNTEHLIDFGTSERGIFERLFELYDKKRIKAVYVPMLLNNMETNKLPLINQHNLQNFEPLHTNPSKYAERKIRIFEKNCKSQNLHPIGYLPWKLMLSDVILEEKDPKWYDTIKVPLTSALRTLKDINSSSDPIKAYNDLYPSVDTLSEDICEDDDMNDLISNMC